MDDVHSVFRAIHSLQMQDFSPQEEAALRDFLARMLANLQEG